jgi:hypothetical protein
VAAFRGLATAFNSVEAWEEGSATYVDSDVSFFIAILLSDVYCQNSLQTA